MRRTLPILLSTAAAAVPLGTALVAGLPVHAASTRAPAHAVQGPSTAMRWGPVQVTIIVAGKHITAITVVAPTERARSAIINNRAVPLLRQEALQAQSAKVQFISGATMTSKAFAASLQAAIKQAHL